MRFTPLKFPEPCSVKYRTRVAPNCDIRIFLNFPFDHLCAMRLPTRSSDFGLYLVRGRRKFRCDEGRYKLYRYTFSPSYRARCRYAKIAEDLRTREGRKQERKEERCKISSYVALSSETDNVLGYTPIKARTNS